MGQLNQSVKKGAENLKICKLKHRFINTLELIVGDKPLYGQGIRRTCNY